MKVRCRVAFSDGHISTFKTSDLGLLDIIRQAHALHRERNARLSFDPWPPTRIVDCSVQRYGDSGQSYTVRTFRLAEIRAAEQELRASTQSSKRPSSEELKHRSPNDL
jgi:hypothetical protein